MDCVSYYYEQRQIGKNPFSIEQNIVTSGPTPCFETAAFTISQIEQINNLPVYKINGEIVDESTGEIKEFLQVLSFEISNHPTGERWNLNGDLFYWLSSKLSKHQKQFKN